MRVARVLSPLSSRRHAEMKIDTADCAASKTSDRIGGLSDFRFRNGFDNNVADAAIGEGSHRILPASYDAGSMFDPA